MLTAIVACAGAPLFAATARADEAPAVPVTTASATTTEPTAATAVSAQPPTPGGACVDEELRDQLVGGRHYRGVQPRLFTKAFRHEFSFLGGWLASDAYDGAPLYGGAYTFHFSEDLGLEASVLVSRAHSNIADTLQQRSPAPIALFNNDRRIISYMGNLVWSLGYGKIRWMGGGISRFDFHIVLGGGVTDDQVSRGLTGSFGLGGKLFLASWLALRFDVRDHLFSQKVLDDTRLVNDILVTGGFSIFFPFKG
ncbi:MAG: outer membrane beta-barrel domain-containing protein [Polyangiales bacterium]